MKRIKLLSLLAISIIIVSSSCSKKPDVENTSTVAMSGEWFIQLRIAGEPVTPFHKIITYNTSDPNSGEIWFDDLDFWPFYGKVPVDYGTLSFKPATALTNEAITGKTVNIIEGKVIPNAAHSKSGNVVDSIYLKAEFSDDPGTEYEYSGHLRTGFFEDEY